jgi:hypothetical protein
MTQFDILLPFALPPAELAKDLLRECKTPSLAMLLARASSARSENFDAFSRALPHEAWLARQFGLTHAADNSPAIAKTAMKNRNLPVEDGAWFVLSPVHLHIARDHLVLTGLRNLKLSEQESRTLFDAARPLFEEAGKALVYGDRHTWFVRADDWRDLRTSTPDVTTGHNIDVWMPAGNSSRAWRKLQNEVQMHWHIHPLNQLREGAGEQPVNSLWLWGGDNGSDTGNRPPAATAYEQVFNSSHWASDFIPGGGVTGDFSADTLIQTDGKRGLLVLDALIAPALVNDWSVWLDCLHRLESEWFAPILSALKSRRLERVSLLLTHSTKLAEFTVTPRSLKKFWAKPSLKSLS